MKRRAYKTFAIALAAIIATNTMMLSAYAEETEETIGTSIGEPPLAEKPSTDNPQVDEFISPTTYSGVQPIVVSELGITAWYKWSCYPDEPAYSGYWVNDVLVAETQAEFDAWVKAQLKSKEEPTIGSSGDDELTTNTGALPPSPKPDVSVTIPTIPPIPSVPSKPETPVIGASGTSEIKTLDTSFQNFYTVNRFGSQTDEEGNTSYYVVVKYPSNLGLEDVICEAKVILGSNKDVWDSLNVGDYVSVTENSGYTEDGRYVVEYVYGNDKIFVDFIELGIISETPEFVVGGDEADEEEENRKEEDTEVDNEETTDEGITDEDEDENKGEQDMPVPDVSYPVGSAPAPVVTPSVKEEEKTEENKSEIVDFVVTYEEEYEVEKVYTEENENGETCYYVLVTINGQVMRVELPEELWSLLEENGEFFLEIREGYNENGEYIVEYYYEGEKVDVIEFAE